MIDKEQVGKRINQVRIDNNLTQEEFANNLDVKRSAISQIENGVIAPSLDLLNNISLVYKISLDWLINGISSDFFKHSALISSYASKLPGDPLTLSQTMLPATEETIAFIATLLEQKEAELLQSEQIIKHLEEKKQLNSQEIQTLKKLLDLLQNEAHKNNR